MQIIAHRGVSAYHHENTIESINAALSLDIQGIEIDIHQVEDEFVVFHDFSLKRLTGEEAELSTLTIAGVKEIKLDGGHFIPTLDEVFDLVNGKVMLNLEIKAITNIKNLINKVNEYAYKTNGDIVISAFNHVLLRNLQQAARNTRLPACTKFGALIAHLPTNYAQYAIELETDIAAIDAYLVDKSFVQHAHSYNKEVWCYTVNTIEKAMELSEMGVDAIFTNDPSLMINNLNKLV